MEITYLPFLEVVQDITSKFNKIPNKDFLNHGKYAIIDQGANIIAGYTNDESVITDLGYPLIVFGDHTRVLKYVNYPFAIGADGVKVLSVNTEKAYPLYVYYFLKFLKIPNAGYSRHFKFLKEKKIALPKDIDDQKRIAKVLSECEALIQKRKESIELLDELLRSTFLEMFGDVLSNSKKYPTKDFVEIIKLKRGFDFPKNERTKGVYPLCASNGVIDYVSEYKVIGPGIVTGRSGTIGKVTLLLDNYWPLNTTLYSEEYVGNPIYLKFLLQFFRLERFTNGAGVPTLNRNLFTKEQIIDVPQHEQDVFSIIVSKIEKIKEMYLESLKELENLYGSISQRAFNGELDLRKIVISNMEVSKKKDPEEVKVELTDEQLEELINSFEHTLPTGEVPSNRETDIRNMSIRQYLRLPDNEETEGIEFSYMHKDFFYQFILTQGFADRTFTLPELEQYARKYILRGTGFEFTYDNWKTIIFRFIGAKQPLIEQVFDEDDKTIKLKLTDEAFKV